MSRSECPAQQDLVAFHLGYLPDARVEAIAAHLEACPACEAFLGAMDRLPDETLESLKRAVLQASRERSRLGQFIPQVGDEGRRNAGPSTEPSAPGRPEGEEQRREPVPAAIGVKSFSSTAGKTTRSYPTAAAADRGPPGDTEEDSSGPRDERSKGRTPSVPGYEIFGELGRGGMGVVYRAREVRLRRPCALKMILAGAHASPEATVRFLAEARAVARLQHPNIVQIHHVGEAEGLNYLELEFVEGGSLEKALDGTPWPAYQAAQLVEALARAMDEVHRLGIVHRDLKPANILFTADGAPKIADFGLAKALEGDSGLTGTASVLGTPSYMAPEQASGHTREAGPSADIYALGTILYELLTGRPPFTAATMLETLEQVKHTEPVPPSRLVPGLPRDLETITLKCLQKEPGKRYASAGALALDLERWRTGQPIVARPISVWGRTVKRARRHPDIAALIAGIVVVTVLGFAGVLWQWRAAESHAARALEKEGEAVASAALARTREREARQALDELRYKTYAQNISFAQRAWNEANLSLMRTLLDDVRPQADGPDHRGFEWYYLNWLNLHRGMVTVLKGHVGEVTSVAFSPDGRRLATSGTDQTVRVWDVGTGLEVLRYTGHSVHVENVAFSPDGQRLASADRNRFVKVWEADSGREVLTLRGHRGVVRIVVFSPDGRRIASASEDQTAKVWDLDTGREVLTLRGHTAVLRGIAFSPDNRRIASASRDGTIRVWDADTGEERLRIEGNNTDYEGVVFSPDGRRIASANGTWGEPSEVKVWDADTGQETHTFKGHTNYGWCVAFSPDGRLLTSASLDGTVRLWNLEAGREEFVLTGHAGMVRYLAYSPDGRRIASASGEDDGVVMIWEAALWERPPLLEEHPDQILTLAYSPDGRLLATAGADRTIRLWEAASGREHLRFEGHSGAVTRVAFRPNGAFLASASADGTARVWSLDDRTAVLELQGHQGDVKAVAFSPDGRRLATAGSDRTIRLWDTDTGRELHTLTGHRNWVYEVAFSPDGRRLASASADRTARVWSLDDRTTVLELQGHQGDVEAVAFSPDGRRLATAGSDRTIRLWDTDTGDEVRFIRWAHNDWITCLTFSPDGRRLVSGCLDGSVSIWDPVTGQRLLTRRDHASSVRHMAFSPDGRRLVSGSWDRRVMAWDAPNDPVQLAETYIQTDSWHQAGATIAEAIKLSPYEPLFHLAQGEIYARQDRMPDAVAEYRETFALDPDVALDWHRRMLAEYSRDGDQSLILLHLDQLIGAELAKRDRPHLLLQRARSHHRLGHWGESAADYAAVLELDPGERHRVYAEVAQTDATLTELIRLRPHDAGLWVARGQSHARAGRAEQAEADFATAIELSPADPGPWIARGRFHAEGGRTEHAEADFATAAELAGDDLQVFIAGGWWVVGPYPEDLQAAFPPEETPDPSQPIAGRSDPPELALRWQPVPTGPDGLLDLGAAFGHADRISVYALTYVYSPEERPATLHLGSHDPLRIWLNGQLIYEHTDPHTAAPDLDHVRMTLSAGRNTLLAKVAHARFSNILILRISGMVACAERTCAEQQKL